MPERKQPLVRLGPQEQINGERVWIVFDAKGERASRVLYEKRIDAETMWPNWKHNGITIRRATLTLDPVKPPRRRQP